MSLINDALKRAKAAQQAAPLPPCAPQLRPAEPDPRVRHGIGYALPVALASIALLLLFFAWRFSRQASAAGGKPAITNSPQASSTAAPARQPTTPAPIPVRARTSEKETSVATATRNSSASTSAQGIAAPNVATPDRIAGPLQAGTIPVDDGHGRPGDNQAATTSVSTNADAAANSGLTNNLAVAVVQPPRPAPPKLQGVIFNPRRPSAVISGKPVFVGDRFGSFSVVAIGRDSATLVGGGKTNVLTLEE